MSEIYAGNDATNRASNFAGNYTILDRLVPLTADGYITKVQIWTYFNNSQFYVGLFRQVSGTSYKCVATSGNLGSVSSGALREFDCLMFGKAGDVVGFFLNSYVEADSAGGDIIYKSGNYLTPGLETNFTSSSPKIASIKLLGYDQLTSSFRETVGKEVGTVVESGDSVMPIEEISPTPKTEDTPFIESIQEGTDIVVKAPKIYQGWIFGFWRIINADGSSSQDSNEQLTLTVSQITKIRAVYFRQMFRESVTVVIGPVYDISGNVSGFRETVEFSIT